MGPIVDLSWTFCAKWDPRALDPAATYLSDTIFKLYIGGKLRKTGNPIAAALQSASLITK
ncbi:hypothetical protein RSAG8_10260, partial [Rhizoctonia solani AG-8 WAC10335]